MNRCLLTEFNVAHIYCTEYQSYDILIFNKNVQRQEDQTIGDILYGKHLFYLKNIIHLICILAD